jgi:hypothetical protein
VYKKDAVKINKGFADLYPVLAHVRVLQKQRLGNEPFSFQL